MRIGMFSTGERPRKVTLSLIGLGLLAGAAVAQQAVSFQGKTVTMIVGYAAGGGTDAFGRLTASFLPQVLPGAPGVIVRNIPGADGITAMNFFVQQAAPDGLTITMASSTTADPMQYRKPQSHYDATRFAVLGGVGRGGVLLVIRRDAEPRLYDKTMSPVVMGALGGVPRSGMQMTAWGIESLGWNAKWVIGYRGTNELILALERGEIDMTSTGNLFQIQKLMDSGRFRVLSQTGTLRDGVLVPRPEFPDAPILTRALDGRIKDALVQKAFDYWVSNTAMDKWLALPPGAPQPMVEIYRQAYGRLMQDADFIERGRRISDDFEPLLHGDVERLVRTLGATPPEAIDYISGMLRRQGLDVQ
jgi:tripartite-type tricarboxylate transporter receptor subunit TctC